MDCRVVLRGPRQARPGQAGFAARAAGDRRAAGRAVWAVDRCRETMDHLIGFVGNGFALVAADRKVAHSIICVKNDEDKILPLDQHKLLACGGELGDTKNFSEYIQKNIALYNLRNGVKLTTHAAAHYTRGEIAHAIRSSPKMCNMLLVGYDEDVGPSLYHIDYMGGMHKMNYGSHGYGGFFAASLLDRCESRDVPNSFVFTELDFYHA